MNPGMLRRLILLVLCLSFVVACSGSGGSGDTTAPTVLSVYPEDNSPTVSASTSVQFSKAMNTQSAQAAFSVTPSVAGTFSWNSDNTIMTFTPGSAPANPQQYVCAVSAAAEDTAGNRLSSPYQWSWTLWPQKVTALVNDRRYDDGYSITADAAGNLYLAGIFTGIADFGSYFGISDPKTSAGGFDIFVTKIDADGTYAWTKRIGGAGGDSGVSAIADDSGNIYLLGTFDGTVDFGADFGVSDVQIATSDSENFLTMIKSDGTYTWTKRGDDAGSSLPGTSLLRTSWYRHLYNDSSYPIEVGSSPDNGNVWFNDCWRGHNKNGYCVVRAHTSQEMQFTTSRGMSTGRLVMRRDGVDQWGTRILHTESAEYVSDRFDSKYTSYTGHGLGGVVNIDYGYRAGLDIRLTDR